MNRSIQYPQHMFWLRNNKNNFYFTRSYLEDRYEKSVDYQIIQSRTFKSLHQNSLLRDIFFR